MSRTSETEGNLRTAIEEHLAWTPNDRYVSIVWGGYLAALVEWEVITQDAYDRLLGLLSDDGRRVAAILLASAKPEAA